MADIGQHTTVDSIALARQQHAKSESYAGATLPRLLRDTGHRDKARAILADIHNWFTGFNAADLSDAKALLEDLGR